MRKQGLWITLMAALALVTVTGCCGGGDDEETTDTEEGNTEAPGVTTAQPGAQGAPGTAIVGGPAVALDVPQVPTVSFTIAEAAEYQIDVSSAAGTDAELHLYMADRSMERDSDDGDGLNARVVRFLAPGNYQARVYEHQQRAMSAQVQVQKLDPLTPVGTLTLGQPSTVTIPETNPRPAIPRFAARSLTLNITAAGTYQCDATAPQEGSDRRDAQMALIQNGQLLEENSDGGDGTNSRITRQLTPGAYIVRVWDWVRRDATITVTCAQQG